MITAKISKNEDQRLQELLQYNVLGTPEDQEYDDIVKLASQICKAPIALISLVDSCRQWFKAELGFGEKETHKDLSFCAHALHCDQVMVVENALEDERFFDNPLVMEGPKIRFYAGAPLISPAGFKLGTLCVLDSRPRSLSIEQNFALETLSRHIVQKFEFKKKNDHLRKVFQQYMILQKEFENKQNSYSKAQKSADIGIFELNVKTEKLKISGSFSELFGFKDEEELKVKDVLEQIHPEDKDDFLIYFREILKEGKQLNYEYRIFQKNTLKEKSIRSTGEIIRNEQGEAIQLIGVKQDITEKKRYEEELKVQNLELIKVNQELDHFVSRVSHDLRAPISTVLGLIDIILNHENDVNKIKDLLQLVKKSLLKQDNFIRDILNYSRNARMPLEVEGIDFRKMVEEIFSHLVYSYNSEKVHYSIVVEQGSDFKTDRSRLYVVLTNVISNSLKYINQQSENASVKVEVQATEAQATISISDTGIGIEEKHLNKVFEMFYRATDQQPGSGLGLYIVKESVERLNGKVKIDSTVGKGTRVTIQIPNLQEHSIFKKRNA